MSKKKKLTLEQELEYETAKGDYMKTLLKGVKLQDDLEDTMQQVIMKRLKVEDMEEEFGIKETFLAE